MRQFLLASLLIAISLPALAIYKCEVNEKIIYSDARCANGKSVDLGEQAPQSTAADITKANEQNAQEKNKLKQLETARHKREAEEEKQQHKIANATASKKKKCASLELKKKWSHEEMANATGKKRENAQRKARRLDEKFALECSK